MKLNFDYFVSVANIGVPHFKCIVNKTYINEQGGWIFQIGSMQNNYFETQIKWYKEVPQTNSI